MMVELSSKLNFSREVDCESELIFGKSLHENER